MLINPLEVGRARAALCVLLYLEYSRVCMCVFWNNPIRCRAFDHTQSSVRFDHTAA